MHIKVLKAKDSPYKCSSIPVCSCFFCSHRKPYSKIFVHPDLRHVVGWALYRKLVWPHLLACSLSQGRVWECRRLCGCLQKWSPCGLGMYTAQEAEELWDRAHEKHRAPALWKVRAADIKAANDIVQAVCPGAGMCRPQGTAAAKAEAAERHPRCQRPCTAPSRWPWPPDALLTGLSRTTRLPLTVWKKQTTDLKSQTQHTADPANAFITEFKGVGRNTPWNLEHCVHINSVHRQQSLKINGSDTRTCDMPEIRTHYTTATVSLPGASGLTSCNLPAPTHRGCGGHNCLTARAGINPASALAVS